jgi:hypothetical protein
MIVGGGEQIELVHAPAVAEVRRRQVARPWYLADRPLAVEPELWHEAQTQLRDALEARGWPLVSDAPLVAKGVNNFMLCGVPIVMREEV